VVRVIRANPFYFTCNVRQSMLGRLAGYEDVNALPLLSYTLDDMWTQMVKRGDGVLRLPAQSFELGGLS
jgi:hypothetical protein